MEHSAASGENPFANLLSLDFSKLTSSKSSSLTSSEPSSLTSTRATSCRRDGPSVQVDLFEVALQNWNFFPHWADTRKGELTSVTKSQIGSVSQPQSNVLSGIRQLVLHYSWCFQISLWIANSECQTYPAKLKRVIFIPNSSPILAQR